MPAPRRHSAGIVLHRGEGSALEVLLVHPGGPTVGHAATLGAWSIPKGEYEPDEDPLAAARREFEEELGTARSGRRRRTTSARSGRRPARCVRGWAVARRPRRQRDHEQHARRSSGRRGRASGLEIPEVDRAEWFGLARRAREDQPGPGRAARPPRAISTAMSRSEAISPTAHYTGYVWARNGLSHPGAGDARGPRRCSSRCAR